MSQGSTPCDTPYIPGHRDTPIQLTRHPRRSSVGRKPSRNLLRDPKSELVSSRTWRVGGPPATDGPILLVEGTRGEGWDCVYVTERGLGAVMVMTNNSGLVLGRGSDGDYNSGRQRICPPLLQPRIRSPSPSVTTDRPSVGTHRFFVTRCRDSPQNTQK